MPEETTPKTNADSDDKSQHKQEATQSPSVSGMLKSLGLDVMRKENPEDALAEAERQEAEAEAGVEKRAAEKAADKVETKPDDKPVEKATRRKTPLPEPVTKNDVKEVVDEAVKRLHKPEAPTKKETETATKDDPLAKLNPRDRGVVELAQFAEAEDPATAGLADRQLGWLDERTRFIVDYEKENGRDSFKKEGLRSDEWQQWLSDNPSPVSPDMIRDLSFKKVKSEAKAEAQSEMAAERKAVDRKIRKIEIGPTIKTNAEESAEYILTADDPAFKSLVENPEEAAKEHKLEVEIIRQHQEAIKADVSTYLEVANDLKDYNANDPAHHALAEFIRKQGAVIDRLPEDKRKQRDGTILVSHDALAAMQADGKDTDGYATFTNDQVVRLIEDAHRSHALSRVQQKRKELEEAGYQRKAKPNGHEAEGGDKEEKAPVKESSPKSTTTRKGPPPSKPASKPVPSYFKSLGIPDKFAVESQS